jgi:hypothetical protein
MSEPMSSNPIGYTDSVRSAKFPTGVNKIMTLLGKSRRAISNAVGVSVTKGIFRSPRPPNVVSKTSFPRVLDLTNRVWVGEVCFRAVLRKRGFILS